MRKEFGVIIVVFLWFPWLGQLGGLQAQEESFLEPVRPVVELKELVQLGALSYLDEDFVLLQKELEGFYRKYYGQRARELGVEQMARELKIYVYEEAMNFGRLRAWFNLSQGALLSLNRVESLRMQGLGEEDCPKRGEDGKCVWFIPNQDGIFLPLETELGDFEKILSSSNERGVLEQEGRFFVLRFVWEGKEYAYRFFPLDRLSASELSFFFADEIFSFPLEAKDAPLSSLYGNRVDPIGGKWQFHKGIDIAAERGTRVLASLRGRVKEVGENAVYGVYVSLEHAKYESFYGHLLLAYVEEGQVVERHHLLGLVGETGQTTGPHLHFEIHKKGSPKNPLLFLKGIQGLGP